jgi:F-type H+-transporting ATPase subunit epsilon
MAENLIHVRLVTPEQTLFDQQVDAVELPARSGNIEVLYGHAPLLSELGAGMVTLHTGATTESYSVSWGFVEVLPEQVTILANQAQKPETIDKAAAEAQLEESHKLWNEAGEDAGKYTEALRLQAEAEAKLNAAGGAQH